MSVIGRLVADLGNTCGGKGCGVLKEVWHARSCVLAAAARLFDLLYSGVTVLWQSGAGCGPPWAHLYAPYESVRKGTCHACRTMIRLNVLIEVRRTTIAYDITLPEFDMFRLYVLEDFARQTNYQLQHFLQSKFVQYSVYSFDTNDQPRFH